VDTRDKILSWEGVRHKCTEGKWLAVASFFDPLTLEQARRLAALASDGRKVLAVVLENENALMNPEARAALMASLRDVAAVVIGERDTWKQMVESDTDLVIHEDLATDAARSDAFVAFVLSRQKRESASATTTNR
jgi:hypothetical protein